MRSNQITGVDTRGKVPQKLFAPIKIRTMQVKNRLCLAPIGGLSKLDGTLPQQFKDFFVARARGGVGMIVVANAIVDESGSVSKHSIRVDDDRFLPGLSMLADTIKKEDVAAVIQINHGGHFAQGRKTISPSRWKTR